ncbi:MAG TPA: trypsin-like peptidase domain-containing protein, partial [Streptosporangiaceae bacterium]
ARPPWLVLRARPAVWGGTLVAVVAVGVMATSPSAHGAERLAVRLAAAVKALPRGAPTVPPALLHGRFYDGTPAVGALFTVSSGHLGSHFCTASVVNSPVKDLVITAAHCLQGKQPGQVAFVPQYHRHHQPYGSWTVTRVFVDAAWANSQNPNDDVAFLVVSQPGSPRPVQELTSGENLATGWKAAQLVRVIGYPDGRQRPITCTARTRPFGTRQMEFDCGGYTDGTSGGPFLANLHPATGLGAVIGVIGGYEQGGDTPSVSYSARFGRAVRDLYDQAVRKN